LSLIYDALKKLDREKQVPERGFLVVSQKPWPTRGRRGWALAGAAGLCLAAVGLATAWWVHGRMAGAPPTGAAAAAPRVPETAPSALPTRASQATVASRSEPAVPPPPVSAVPATTGTAPPASAPPTLPTAPVVTTPAPPGLVLQAISQRDGQPVALLSDRLVREGDSFDGVRVLRIGDEEVEVEVDGERRVIRF